MTAPTRWKDAPESTGIEGRAGALFRAVPAPEPLDEERLARIESRLGRRLASRAGWPKWLKRAVGVFAVVGAPFAFAAIARAVWPDSAPARPSIAPFAPAVPVEPAAEPAGLLAFPDEMGVDLTEPPSPAPAKLAKPARLAPSKSQAPARFTQTASGTERAPADTRASEASLLQRAVVQLRIEKNPAGALATLDRHRREFARPHFLGDALNHRVSALVALGRKDEALAELERFDTAELEALDGERLLLSRKGERLAELGRAAEAVRVFDLVLDESASPLVEQRALYGRAVARARLGDHTGSRADLERYLERWPNGPHAKQARSALAR